MLGYIYLVILRFSLPSVPFLIKISLSYSTNYYIDLNVKRNLNKCNSINYSITHKSCRYSKPVQFVVANK